MKVDAAKAKQLVAAHRVKDAIKPILSLIEKAAKAGQESITVWENKMPKLGVEYLRESGFKVEHEWTDAGDNHRHCRDDEHYIISWA
jgi:hypothetical protein